jgi:hypothetical protein
MFHRAEIGTESRLKGILKKNIFPSLFYYVVFGVPTNWDKKQIQSSFIISF